MKEKYVEFELPSERREHISWNTMFFRGCKIMDISIQGFDAGKRLSITIAAPKLHKRFYLYAWSDSPVFEAIANSGLQKGDIISCYTELSYYKGKEGYTEAYQIVPNYAFASDDKESSAFFKLMHIRRESKAEADNKAAFLTADDLLKKMLG